MWSGGPIYLQMATEHIPDSIQQPTTIRFSEDLRRKGELIARKKGLKFADVVRLALSELIRHEDKHTDGGTLS